MTWSATSKFVKDNGQDLITNALQTIRSAWGEPDTLKRKIEWPLSVRIFRNVIKS